MEQSVVLRNMQIIEDTFREVQELFPTLTEEQLVVHLESYPLQFRSIAYEAASMQFALADLKNGRQFTGWAHFLKRYAALHITQFHIGLGWALAQEQLIGRGVYEQVEDKYRSKVYDGSGYYDGLFRRRKAILQQDFPVVTNLEAIFHYNVGLGRSVWYSTKGIPEMAAKVIDAFPEDRRLKLWIGLGTAIAYVGGFSKQMLEEIAELAGDYKKGLHIGAKSALLSRQQAGSINEYVLMALRVWDID